MCVTNSGGCYAEAYKFDRITYVTLSVGIDTHPKMGAAWFCGGVMCAVLNGVVVGPDKQSPPRHVEQLLPAINMSSSRPPPPMPATSSECRLTLLNDGLQHV